MLAILIGTAVRSALRPDDRFSLGIRFSAKTLLEIAVVLLGASVSARAVMAAGPMLLAGIVGVVVVAITASYGIGRALGLEHKLATLVACGNSICGNSAIVAAAPVIGATAGDVAASIAFTAVLGVVVVLLLPLLVPLLHLSDDAVRRAGGPDRLCRAAGDRRDRAGGHPRASMSARWSSSSACSCWGRW